MNKRKAIGLVCLAALVAAPSAASAETSASAGMDIVNEYYFRGIPQTLDGANLQPWAEMGIGVYSGEGAFSSFGFVTGIWSSLNSDQGGHPSGQAGPASWYEADYYGGLSFGFADDAIGVDILYTAYMSPNGAFGTVHELSVGLGYDDSGLWGDGMFGGFQPGLTVALELDGTAFGADEGTYVELGIEPSLALVETDAIALGLGVPLSVGLSAADYYVDAAGENTAFGYFSGGVSLSAGLSAIPEEYGSWSLGVFGNLLMMNGDSTSAGTDDVKFLAGGSISVDL